MDLTIQQRIKEFYTIREAAELIGCSRSYLWQMCRHGQITAFRLNGRGRYRIQGIEVLRRMKGRLA